MHRPLQKETLEIQWVARLSVEPRPPIKMTIFCPWFFKKAYQFQQAASISSVDCLSTGIPTDRFLCCSWRLQAAHGEVEEEEEERRRRRPTFLEASLRNAFVGISHLPTAVFAVTNSRCPLGGCSTMGLKLPCFSRPPRFFPRASQGSFLESRFTAIR